MSSADAGDSSGVEVPLIGVVNEVLLVLIVTFTVFKSTLCFGLESIWIGGQVSSAFNSPVMPQRVSVNSSALHSLQSDILACIASFLV